MVNKQISQLTQEMNEFQDFEKKKKKRPADKKIEISQHNIFFNTGQAAHA